jgi:hypothetical protein
MLKNSQKTAKTTHLCVVGKGRVKLQIFTPSILMTYMYVGYNDLAISLELREVLQPDFTHMDPHTIYIYPVYIM